MALELEAHPHAARLRELRDMVAVVKEYAAHQWREEDWEELASTCFVLHGLACEIRALSKLEEPWPDPY